MMSPDRVNSRVPSHTHCCPCGTPTGSQCAETTRREFLAAAGAMGLLGTALTGLSWAGLSAPNCRSLRNGDRCE